MSYSNEPVVSVIMPMWNRQLNNSILTRRAIESLERHTSFPYELIVVDNDSPEHHTVSTPDLRKLLIGEGAKLYRLPENIGFGPACNLGFKMARGQYFCQMNTDVELVEDSIAILIYFMERFEFEVAMPEHFENCQHYNLEKSDAAMGKDWRFGAFWIATREIIECVGGFDEAYEMCYFEDTDLWKRIEAAGGRIAGYRGTWVKHMGQASSHPLMREYFAKNKELFEERHGPPQVP